MEFVYKYMVVSLWVHLVWLPKWTLSGFLYIPSLNRYQDFKLRSSCFPKLLLSRSEFAGNEAQNSDKQVLNIYDLCNKFIAYSSIFDDIVDVLAEWGSLYVLTRDGKIHVLQEKDTQTKLEARNYVFLLVSALCL